MDETIEYIGERFPELTDEDLGRLHEIGMRFCKPAVRSSNTMEGASVA
jgi:hypothetical protein